MSRLDSKLFAHGLMDLINQLRVVAGGGSFFGLGFLVVGIMATAAAQDHRFPKTVRGYKVERTVVEIRNSGTAKNNSKPKGDREGASDPGVDSLIQFGEPRLARITPLGITFEVPVVVAPVKQSGHVEFLLFEDMVLNGTPVEIDEYRRDFNLPSKKPLTLSEPLRFYVYLPRAALAAVGEWTDSKDSWPLTGRVYVFGKFKKGIFSFKRCIPVELDLVMRNPLKEK